MTDDQFDKLYRAFSQLRTEMNDRFDDVSRTMATKAEMNAVYDLLDKNISEHQRQDEERLVMAAQLDRHDRQISQLAVKNNTTLTN